MPWSVLNDPLVEIVSVSPLVVASSSASTLGSASMTIFSSVPGRILSSPGALKTTRLAPAAGLVTCSPNAADADSAPTSVIEAALKNPDFIFDPMRLELQETARQFTRYAV